MTIDCQPAVHFMIYQPIPILPSITLVIWLSLNIIKLIGVIIHNQLITMKLNNNNTYGTIQLNERVACTYLILYCIEDVVLTAN